MLIKIDFSQSDIDKMPKGLASKLFERIADASESGFHQIFLSAEVAKHLLELDILSFHAIGAIQRIAEDSTQLGGQFSTSSSSMTVKFSESEFIEQDGQNFILSHRNLLTGNYLREPLLVVEDFKTDGRFYKFVLEYEAKKNEVSISNFDIAHGGGERIKSQLEEMAKSKRIVIFVLDQDSIVPLSDLKNRIKQLEQRLNKGNCVGFVKYTPTHEVENFLPLSVIEKIGKKMNKSDLNKVAQLIQHQGSTKRGDCLWLYYDTKIGMKGARNSNGQIGIKNYAKLNADDISWLCKKYQIENNELQIEKLNYPGFGENIISKFWMTPMQNLNFSDLQTNIMKLI